MYKFNLKLLFTCLIILYLFMFSVRRVLYFYDFWIKAENSKVNALSIRDECSRINRSIPDLNRVCINAEYTLQKSTFIEAANNTLHTFHSCLEIGCVDAFVIVITTPAGMVCVVIIVIAIVFSVKAYFEQYLFGGFGNPYRYQRQHKQLVSKPFYEIDDDMTLVPLKDGQTGIDITESNSIPITLNHRLIRKNN
jgi:hypothetical protein